MQIDLSEEEAAELMVALATSRNQLIEQVGKAHMLWHSNSIKDQLTKQIQQVETLQDRIRELIRAEKKP